MTTRVSRLAAARLTLGLIATSLAGTLLSPMPVRAATIAVGVADFDFSPASRTISVGDVVRWSFSGSSHSVTSRDGVFDSGIKDAGGSFQFTFTEAGTYRYYCVVHPDLMSGTIVVKAASATPRPTARPTATPRPTPKPTATSRPAATVKPTAKPVATSRPAATVKPTAKPVATPAPSATEVGPSPTPSAAPIESVAPTGSPAASEAIVDPASPSSGGAPAPVPAEPANASDTMPIVAGAVLLALIIAVGGLLLARRRRAI